MNSIVVQKICVIIIIQRDQILYCPTDAVNYINCRVIKNTLK